MHSFSSKGFLNTKLTLTHTIAGEAREHYYPKNFADGQTEPLAQGYAVMGEAKQSSTSPAPVSRKDPVTGGKNHKQAVASCSLQNK